MDARMLAFVAARLGRKEEEEHPQRKREQAEQVELRVEFFLLVVVLARSAEQNPGSAGSARSSWPLRRPGGRGKRGRRRNFIVARAHRRLQPAFIANEADLPLFDP